MLPRVNPCGPVMSTHYDPKVYLLPRNWGLGLYPKCVFPGLRIDLKGSPAHLVGVSQCIMCENFVLLEAQLPLHWRVPIRSEHRCALSRNCMDLNSGGTFDWGHQKCRRDFILTSPPSLIESPNHWPASDLRHLPWEGHVHWFSWEQHVYTVCLDLSTWSGLTITSRRFLFRLGYGVYLSPEYTLSKHIPDTVYMAWVAIADSKILHIKKS